MKEETKVIKSKALFSDDGLHRFLLRKEWDNQKKSAMIIMINVNFQAKYKNGKKRIKAVKYGQ